MKNKKKQNEMSVIATMASAVSENIADIELTLNSGTAKDLKATDSLFFNLLQTTEKNYFTHIEREDIFLIACHIQNLNDELFILKDVVRNEFYIKPDKLKKSVSLLSNLFNDCIVMLRELEKLPKCNGMSQIYKNFKKNLINSDDNTSIINCKNYCKKMADCIYFSYLKNT